MLFAPGFYNGTVQFGEWQVTSQLFVPGWFGGNVNRDVAFLTVRGDVQARAGAEKLGYSSPAPKSVRVEGYSPLSGPVVCNRKPGFITVAGQVQLQFDCPGYSNASSGAPFLSDISPESGQGDPIGPVLHRIYSRLAQ